MFSLSSNGIITMNRAESGSFTVELNRGTTIHPEIITLNSRLDNIYFGVVEPKCRFENSIVRKVYHKDDVDSNNCITISLIPEDTELLLPGTYYYEVKVEIMDPTKKERNKSVYTVVPRTKLIIME